MCEFWTKVLSQLEEVINLLSRNCDGGSQMKACSKRYHRVLKGEKVYCPDGTAHLVDCASDTVLSVVYDQT